jgi:AF2212-like protein
MGKTVRGIYENGEIRLLEDPQITGKQEVYVVFPDDEESRVRGIPASAFQEIDGIVALGGNALADAEGLWEEHLRAPDHH